MYSETAPTLATLPAFEIRKLVAPEETAGMVDGTSMIPLIRESAGSDETQPKKPAPHRDILHGEHTLGVHSSHFIITETDKYIWYSQTGLEQYFDLSADPHELHDLIGSPERQARIGFLRGRLIRALTGREEGYTDGSSLLPGKTPQALLKNLMHY